MTSPAPPLLFGIYPGGAAGTVSPGATPRPENPTLRLAALRALRPAGAPLILHLYATYTGPRGLTAAQQVGGEIANYTVAGFKVELVLAYRPASGGTASDVKSFAAFARGAVSAFKANPGVVSLQVTNEANQGGAPNAADGYYRYVKDALIQGVIAAKAQTRTDGARQIEIGFNWANANDSGQNAFWSYLGKRGGQAFASSVDWVGLDAYPGTWGPAIDTSNLSVSTTTAVEGTLGLLRTHYLPLAKLGPSVALHLSESGYPTGPGRTPAMQALALTAAVTAVDAVRGAYNVTQYNWFDLRDASSSSLNFEDQYGLLTDTYAPKPAFTAYQQLIAQLGVAH